jgi:hypothetical protein
MPNLVQAVRGRVGGVEGNVRLTAVVAAVLIVLLAVEGATIPFLGSLLSVHVFVGMLLLVPVALKLASTGYRFARYYAGSADYVAKGPPIPLMRLLVAPVLVFSTLTLFGSGVLLITADPHHGKILLLHKASFIVWFGAMTIHVLAYARRAALHAVADWTSRRVGGASLRVALVVGALAAGLAVAIVTLPLATPWSHRHHSRDERLAPVTVSALSPHGRPPTVERKPA